MRVSAVLFDLDGTLADTAPDLGHALNRLLARHGRTQLAPELIRPQASHGARGLLRLGFGIEPGAAGFEDLREEFLALYTECLCRDTRLFPGIPELLDDLERRGLAWGVVTNKPQRFTLPLLEQLGVAARAACIVSGDVVARPKPAPDALLEAASQVKREPSECLYVGDDERDIQAGAAAGMRGIVACYGYLGSGRPPGQWGGAGMIDHPSELRRFL